MTPIDVSNLTRDPTTLVGELKTGTTGIPSVDQSRTGESANQSAFIRLAELMVGPTAGAWTGFGQEMLRTLSLMPGVVSLGQSPAHSGAMGQAFSTPNQTSNKLQQGSTSSDWKSPVLVLDQNSGQLLEARNFPIPVLQAAGTDFIENPSEQTFSGGVSYGVSTKWVDPLSPLALVPPDSVPSWISQFHIIETSAATGIARQTAIDEIQRVLGGNISVFESGTGQSTFDITFKGGEINASASVASLEASGLFRSVVFKA